VGGSFLRSLIFFDLEPQSQAHFWLVATVGIENVSTVAMMEKIQRWKWWLFAVIVLGGAFALYDRYRSFRESSQDAVILAAGRHYGVDPALVKAVVWRESWFNPDSKGRSGEIGLMQIMENTAGDWAKAERVHLFTHFQLYDPAKNTQAGTWYLRKLWGQYARTDNPLPYTLAAYNAGPGRVAEWRKGSASTNSAVFLSQISFPRTKKYVQEVTQRFERYRKVFPSKKT
jgi:soluble lytic murein transglycosylase